MSPRLAIPVLPLSFVLQVLGLVPSSGRAPPARAAAKDRAEAERLPRRAAELGDPRAKARLAALEEGAAGKPPGKE